MSHPVWDVDPCAPDLVQVHLVACGTKDVLMVLQTSENVYRLYGAPTGQPSPCVVYNATVPADTTFQIAWVADPVLNLSPDVPMAPYVPSSCRNVLKVFSVNGQNAMGALIPSVVPGTPVPPDLALDFNDLPIGAVLTYVPY